MFESLREPGSGESSPEGSTSFGLEPGLETPPAAAAPGGLFLGMTASQRLIIAILLLVSVCALGTMCLMVTGRIGIL